MLCQPGVYLLVDLRADPLNQPLGHGPLVRSAKFGMHGCRCSDVLVPPLVPKTKLYRDRPARQCAALPPARAPWLGQNVATLRHVAAWGSGETADTAPAPRGLRQLG